ncbi:STAS domain-containing protein [Streptomyces sp. TR02-1]|uniref:STAS domain-containing protein n=1 Tax=Streptomyces sp. TR02-1 TaxID=3385977 RepID=UPI0039A0FBAC
MITDTRACFVPTLHQRDVSSSNPLQCTTPKPCFVLDLGFVTFLDSVGLGVIIAITKRVRENGGSVRIASASGLILRIFHISGLDQTYEFHASQREATLRGPLVAPPD